MSKSRFKSRRCAVCEKDVTPVTRKARWGFQTVTPPQCILTHTEQKVIAYVCASCFEERIEPHLIA